MELAILLETLVKIHSKNRTPDGSGAAPGETQTPTTKIGVDRETEHNPPVLAFLPETTMPWTSL